LEDEKKQLRQSLDDAENQLTKAELVRRALDGDLQRLKMALNDKETETQVEYSCTFAHSRVSSVNN
jgi:phage shock protein A